MKKKYFVMFTLVILALGGCSTKEAAPQEEVASEPVGQKVSAYYYAPYADTPTVEAKLKDAGFDIVATYPSTQQSDTIIITNKALKEEADKPGRGFAAILRVLVDRQRQRVAVTDPVYFGKAFMQAQYEHALGIQLTDTLSSALGVLTPSEETLPYDDLAEYQFMIGMPTYAVQYNLAEGDSAMLLDELESYNEGKAVVFVLALGRGRTLVGFDLDERTKTFLEKIGTQNAELLPYTILIEEGKATALRAEYYVPISYPKLSMGEFMTIATLPGAVEKELKKPFESLAE